MTASLERHMNRAIQCGNAERGPRGDRMESTQKIGNVACKATGSHVTQRCMPQRSLGRAGSLVTGMVTIKRQDGTVFT